MDLQSNPTQTRTATVYLDRNGIIVITMKDCGVVDEYDLIDLHLVLKHKTEGKPSLKLLFADGDWEMNKKAKAYAKSQDNLNQTLARAIVFSSKIKATMFNYLQAFNKNKNYPVQFFNDEESAYEWLMTFKKSE